MEQQTFEFKEEKHFLGFTNPSSNLKLNIGGDKKITAVEWLVKTIGNAYKEGIFEQHFCKDIERAKQMEKEQLINAVYDTMEFDPNVEAAEKYYNKTYGK